jgi:hypothetical protein
MRGLAAGNSIRTAHHSGSGNLEAGTWGVKYKLRHGNKAWGLGRIETGLRDG